MGLYEDSLEDFYGCWLWSGPVGSHGYGIYGARGLAHRLAWESFYGLEIPKGKMVLHRCDTPRCVRPQHLFLGDQFDNMRDMWTKGRSGFQNGAQRPRGEGHKRAKLTWDAVKEIRGYAGIADAAFARKFGVDRAAVRRVRLGETW